MPQEASIVNRGIYNNEYFSGAQVSLYIGDVWVDEVTTLSYGIQQSRRPIYGYASQLYDDVAEGHVIVQGNFSINFKEAGYLWLILTRYAQQFVQSRGIPPIDNPFLNSNTANRQNINGLLQGELSGAARNRRLLNLSSDVARKKRNFERSQRAVRRGSAASLGGFASNRRTRGAGSVFENEAEQFEDAVWSQPAAELDQRVRRTDDPRLNPFDMYIAFGDFAGDGSVNHTIERLTDVTLLGDSKQIVIDGMPIQEQYTFIARNKV